MKIQRERWVIIRNETEIFCGLAKNYKFKPIDDIGDTAIKTYLGKNKAESSFEKSWGAGRDLIASGEAKAVKVIETIEGNIENGCSGCVYEDADGSTDAISNCVCCNRNVDFALSDNYRKK